MTEDRRPRIISQGEWGQMGKIRRQNTEDKTQSTDSRKTKKQLVFWLCGFLVQSCSRLCNLNLSAVILTICVLLSLPSPLLAREKKDGIELPEMVITGEDRSVLTREEKKEELLVPESEDIDLEKESARESLPGYIAKREKRYLEEKYLPSFFEVSYGSHNTLDYKLVHRQRVRRFNYLIKADSGSSDGFDWEDYSSFGNISRHSLEGEVGFHHEDWGVEGAVDYGMERIYLPYQDKTENISAGGIRLGGIMAISPRTDIGAGIKFSGGSMQEEDITSTSIGSNFEFNTLLGNLPVGIGTRTEHFLIDSQETDITSLFAQSKGLGLDSFCLDIRAGVDNHKDHNQELNLGLDLSWPWGEMGRLSLGYEKEMKGLSFKELYLDNNYVTPNKDLLPVRMEELRFRGNYRLSKEAFFNFTLFAQEARDYIVLEDGNSDHLYSPTNIDASITGAEIEVRSYLTPHLTQRSSLKFTRAQSKEEGRVVPLIPAWKAALLLKYLSEHGLEVSLNPEYVGQRKDGLDEAASEELDGYFLLHARLAQYFFNNALTLFLYGKNLLDEEYLERIGYPGWPRSYGGGFIWRF